ncbi:MAG TPA: isoprenylcysteine carboxylmethyltransferase family protein [Steroidobacter sp.]|nr:isoprenylcysteine carboxylmethyltransferase family protein [Steroidobacter sp.]
MTLAHAIFWFVVIQRLLELAFARRNTRILKEQGGIESGRGHYPVIVLLHISWLVAIWLGIQRDPSVRWFPLSIFLLLQVMRLWVIATLGRFWTTRVISVAGEPLVRRGPYRYFAHPNYLVVIGEITMLPLVFGQVENAVMFTLINLAILGWRIRVENAALERRRTLGARR